MNTPWGKSDARIPVQRGFSWVGTPSHGGFALTRKFLSEHLTDHAFAYAESYGGNYFFEEDVDYAIVAWEMGKFSSPLTQKWDLTELGLGTFTRESLLKTLSLYRPDYLQKVGVTPLPEEFAIYLARKQEEVMRAAKHPNLVVSARGDWAGHEKGWVELTTADGMLHLVLASEYDNRANLNLLSNYPSAKPYAVAQ